MASSSVERPRTHVESGVVGGYKKLHLFLLVGVKKLSSEPPDCLCVGTQQTHTGEGKWREREREEGITLRGIGEVEVCVESKAG